MSSFENLRVVDNFYQTSLFFPMPTVVISTLCEDGTTTLGPYSLVQPYYVAGKDYYAMLLSCRNSSNTAQNILRNGKCALNFVDDIAAADYSAGEGREGYSLDTFVGSSVSTNNVIRMLNALYEYHGTDKFFNK